MWRLLLKKNIINNTFFVIPAKEAVAEPLKYAKNVIPSKEGIQIKLYLSDCFFWIPVFTGMTDCADYQQVLT